VALHGRGSDERDLLALAPSFDPHYLWLSPRAPLGLGDGYEWYRLLDIGQPDPATFAAAVSALAEFIADILKTYPVDPKRLFLLGFSQGGMMAYAYALRWPERVAGIIAHSSYIPAPAKVTPPAPALVGKPCLVVHGLSDPVIPAQWGREAHAYLTAVGAEAQLHEAPIGHAVSHDTLAVMRAWLLHWQVVGNS
jgi:phospholipase/carboxylesterase